MSPAALRRPLDPAYIGSPFTLQVPFLQETESGRAPLDLAGRNVGLFLDRQGLPDHHIEIVAADAGGGVALFEEADTDDWHKGDYSVEVRLDGVSVVVGRISVAQGAAAKGSDMVGATQPPSTQGVVIAAEGVVQVVLPPQGLKGDKGDSPTDAELGALIDPIVQSAMASLLATVNQQALLIQSLEDRVSIVETGDDPDRYMFFATRARQPSGTMTVAAAGTQFKTSLVRFANAPYANRKFRIHFSGFALNEAGTSPVESVLPGNATTIHKVFLVYGDEQYPLSFSGAAGTTIASGSNGVWSDELILPSMSANAGFGIATVYSTAVGENQLPVYRMQRHRGERIWGAATAEAAEAFLTDLTQASTPVLDPDTSRGSNGQPSYYGPDMMVAAGGWDGRPVALVTNDSIGDSRNEYSCSADVRGNSGWLRRWLDMETGPVGRIPHFMMGVPGQAAYREMQAADSSLKRWEVLDELIALNGGKRPFTFGFNQMGQNDTTSAAAYQARVRGIVERLKARYPGLKVIQSIPMGRTTSTDRWLTTANQTFEGSNVYPTATKWLLRDYIIANTGGWHDGYIDTFAAWSDPVALGKWPAAPTEVQAVTTAPISGTSYTFDTDRELIPGQFYALGNFTGITVGYSLPNPDGTWTNDIANGSTATVPAGTPLYISPTNDGLHPSLWMALRMASLLPATEKNKLVFA